MKNKPLQFGNTMIHPGERITVALPTPEIYTCAPMYIPIHVIHGKNPGPCLLLCSAIHGDETNGLALIQKLMQVRRLNALRGTLIAIPVINIFGLLNNSRILPDRRDLDGSFPGSETGSFASRLANHITREILDKADFCVDIHSGEPHYCKLPQIHTNMNHGLSREMASYFHAPIILHTESKRGMLWQIKDKEKPTVIYETGEALRLDEFGIRTGVRGVLQLMWHLGMLKFKKMPNPPESLLIRSTKWIRTPHSGLCTLLKKNGSQVKRGDRIFRIADPFGTSQTYEAQAELDGIIVGQNNLPMVNEGEPILEIAVTHSSLEETDSHFASWREEGLGRTEM